MMGNSDPIKIDLIGFNQRMLDTLVMVMKGPAKDVCQLSEDDSAVAVIIDWDAVGAQELLSKYRSKNPERFAIALSVKEGNIESADEVMIKPIKIPDFCATMKRVSDHLRSQPEKSVQRISPPPMLQSRHSAVIDSPIELPITPEPEVQKVHVLAQDLDMSITMELKAFSTHTEEFKSVCGDAEDIDFENKEQVSGLFVSMDNRLLGTVLQAKTEAQYQRKPILIKLKSVPLFLLLPQQQTIKSTIKDDMLQRFCGKEFPVDSLQIEPVTLPPPEMDNASSEAIESLLWKLSAWSYCGKLPSNIKLQDRVFLRHWPNLTRLLELPDAMRISALLVEEHPMTLQGIAEALAIPQRHVFAYFSAAHTIGLMGEAKRKSDLLIEQPVKLPEQNNRKLLGRMMGHLRRYLS